MRLGEMLLSKGMLSPDQLQAALHEQRRYRGRLGTHLVQMGYVGVDTVALALSVQRGFPPVLRAHVASLDPRLLTLFPGRIVTAHRAIPIGYTTHKPPRVVVACADPSTTPIDELAFAAGTRIEAWIAPEALIQACMEKYFGVAPAGERYVSIKLDARDAASLDSIPVASAAPAEPPKAPTPKPAPAAEPKAKTRAKAKARVLSPPPPPPSIARPVLEPPPPPLPPPPPPPEPEPEPELEIAPPPPQDLAPPEPPPQAPLEDELPPEDDWDLADELPVAPARPVTVPPEARPVTAPPEALRPVISRAEASMSIEMATSKEPIGRVLEDWLRSAFGCGLVLVVKGDMAIGWKGFFPDAEDLIEAVAVPLGKPSMFSVAHDTQAPFRGAPPADGAKLQERLWKLLRCAAPAEALVVPVLLGKRTVNLLYAHMEDGSALPDDLVKDAEALAADAAAAYARLIGRKKR